MLFGRSAWAGRPQRQQQSQSPLVQQQPAQTFQPPAAQWAAPTQDMGYANQLAQYYASQMPNQQVPGSAPTPQQPPQQAQPVAQEPVQQNPLAGTRLGGTALADLFGFMGQMGQRPAQRSPSRPPFPGLLRSLGG